MIELADTSAWIWKDKPSVSLELRGTFETATTDGNIAMCDMVRLELLRSARNAREFENLALEFDQLPDCPIDKDQWRRAVWVYQQLSKQGGSHQRSVKHPDLLIAAAAEAAEVTLLHYDEDYERIAKITGQPTRWLAPPGTLR